MIPKHFISALLFSIIAIISHFSTHESDKSFQTFSLLLIVTLLMACVMLSTWMGSRTNTYFLFVLLFSMANRMAKYQYPSLAEYLTPLTELMIAGLVFISAYNNQGLSAVFFTGILLIDYINSNMPFDKKEYDSFYDYFPKNLNEIL